MDNSLIRRAFSTKKLSLIFSLIFIATSCQTVERIPQSAGDCSIESRAPASLYCQDLFDASGKTSNKNPQRPLLNKQQVKKNLIEVSVKDLTAPEIARLWEPLTFERDWNRLHDDAFWASLIGRERLQSAKDRGVHPVSVFGEETSFNWQASLRRLDRIPIGEFRIDLNLVSNVNRDIHSAALTHANFLSGEAHSKVFAYPSRVKALINKYLPTYGGTFRRMALYNLHNVLKPFSEGEYNNIQTNSEISGISLIEMPWSRPGKRYGIFRYPPPLIYRAKLEALIKETNERVQSLRDGRSKEDPIDLAAEFQWRFVQIHPLVNGNGRTSRALMTRILAEFGLPPSSRRLIDVDYTLSLQEQKDLTREGVIESLILAAGQEKSDSRITSYRRGFGTRLTTSEIQSMTKNLIGRKKLTYLSQLFPQHREQIMTFAGKRFTLSDDLMFIDQHGIPYTARFHAGQYQLFPIADKTYTLYGWGGNFNGIKGLQRDLNPSLEAAMKLNIELLQKVEQDPSLATRVRLNRYESIERENHNDQYAFTEWDIPLLLEVTKIKEDPNTNPMAVLVQNRGDLTELSRAGRDFVEKAFFLGKTDIPTPDLIGHYLLMDQRFHELARHLKNPAESFLRESKIQQTLLRQIEESRTKLHAATRKMMENFIQEIAVMTPETREYLMEHPQFRLVYEYFLRTPLAYKTLAEAQKNLDPDKTVVLRSAAAPRIAITGFMSDVQVRDAIWSIPFIGPRFEKFLQNVSAEWKRQAPETDPEVAAKIKTPAFAKLVADFGRNNQSIRNAVDALLQFVFVQPYSNRTLDAESSRAFVTQYLHTQLDLGPKETLSRTANSAYLLAEKDGAFEAKFAWQDATIYILEVPRENLRVDTSSGFIAQQEVGMKPLGPIASRRAIQFKLRADELNTFFMPKAEPTPQAQKIIEMLREAPRVDEKPGPTNGQLEWFKSEVAMLPAAGF